MQYFFCGVDGDRLMLTKGKYSLYYRCPRYELKNRKGDEGVCMNRLSIDDQELMFSELENLDDDDEIVKGVTGQIRHLLYEIADVNEDYLLSQYALYHIIMSSCDCDEPR